MSDSPIPPFIKPPAYYNGGTVDAEAPYNIAATLRTAATYRSLMLASQVYGHPDYTQVYFIDVQNWTEISSGRVIVPPNALYLNYQVVFLVADRGSPATVNHRVRLWDGGSETTGWVETGMVEVKQSALTEAWAEVDTPQESRDFQRRFGNIPDPVIFSTKSYEEQKYARRGADVIMDRKTRRYFVRDRNYQLPATNGASLYEWPTNRIVGQLPMNNSNLLGTTSAVYWELNAQGTDGSVNYDLYKPLFVSAWITCGDSL